MLQSWKGKRSNNKISVHFFVPSLRGGGAERVTVNLLRELDRKLFQPTIILAKKIGPYLDQLPLDVPIVDLGVHHVRHAFPKLLRYLYQEHPDILLSVMGYTNVIALLAQRLVQTPTKFLVSVHSPSSKSVRETQHLKGKLVPHFERWLYSKADGVIAVSQGVKDDISDYLRVSRERIAVLYNPIVDRRIFELAQKPVDHPWFCDSVIPLILAAGRLGKPKDYPTLLRAFKLIYNGRPARLVILGEGQERAHLENLAQELGITDNVALLGFQENPYRLMAKASIFALSSSREGFPTALVEAMACGVPVVSTDCPFGPREIITKPGYNGLLVPVGDPEALAKAILQVLENKNLAMRLAEAGKKRAKDFEVGKITREYEELFKSVL